jgi:large subunit ribosomal protein L17
MRHHSKKKILSRKRGQRVSLLKSLAISFIREEAIHTTLAKAKTLRPFVEKLITKAKVDNVANRRLLARRIGGKNQSIISKLFKEIGPRYQKRNGGYTRIIKIGPNRKNAIPMARIELV